MSRQSRGADTLSAAAIKGKTASKIASKGLRSMTRSEAKKIRTKSALSSRGTIAPLLDDSDEENGSSDIIQEDEQTTDNSDDDGIAPSISSPRRRGNQTGLSISLSNTGIAHDTRKRSWSDRAKEEKNDDMKRPAKLTKREAKNTEDEDSDAGYEAVDLISDSDEDDTERDEEAMIIQSEQQDDDTLRPASSSSSSSSDSWIGFSDHGFSQESNFFTEHFERTNSARKTSPKSTRKVRFVDEVDEVESTSADTTDLEDDFFPDLFLRQDRLDSRFRAIIEKESDSEGSYWDFGFGDHDIYDPAQGLEGEGDDNGESSGYESMF